MPCSAIFLLWMSGSVTSTLHSFLWIAVYLIAIKLAMVVCLCQHVWSEIGLLQHIDCWHYLWYQQVPLVDWKTVVNSREHGDEMIFVSLDAMFCNISSVNVWWCDFNFAFIFVNCCLFDCNQINHGGMLMPTCLEWNWIVATYWLLALSVVQQVPWWIGKLLSTPENMVMKWFL